MAADAAPGRRRLPARLFALTVLLFTLLVGGAGVASAHASLDSTDPANGSTVPSAPSVVTMRFSEGVDAALGGVKVLDPTGKRVDTGSPEHGVGGPSTLRVKLQPGLGPGTYTVAWRVVSEDSHPISGAFTFNIVRASAGGGVGIDQGGDDTVGFFDGLARGVAFGTFALLTGSVLFLVALRPAAVGRFRVWLLLFASWAGLLVSTVAALMLYGPKAAGLPFSSAFDLDVLRTTLESKLGRALSVRILILGAAGALLGYLVAVLGEAGRRRRAVLGGAWALLCVGMAATWAASDHASVGMQAPLAMSADIVHLVAMGCWLGGLAVLLVLLFGPDKDEDGEELPGALDVPTVGWFSKAAMVCVTVLAVTGVYAGWRQIGSFDALFSTTFGLLLILKVNFVLLMIAAAWVARRWLQARLRAKAGERAGEPLARKRTLQRAVGTEAVLAIVVLAVTTVLVNTEPGRTAHEREEATTSRTVSVSSPYDAGGPAGKGVFELVVTPARAGVNSVDVSVRDPLNNTIDPPEVTLSVSLPEKQIDGITVALQRTGPGQWSARDLSLPMAGTWKFSVSVRTGDFDRATVVVPVKVR
ncbi:copper resistance CopC/CopD family protein [Yinghuangia seranimata]|uniref:copper resistance CopC/CopD family protein n=1 Tax=Yinghuangia seranimata TaxID=408067 RepID=UPI00248B8A6D|nr:copper resistance protein CopC [Yinghuangia seranimata]MDI2131904.1 copper resistance protein CopC [Yinghuangia seranimata]